MQTQTNKPKQKSTIWIFSLSQRHYTCSVCPLFWLELPLGHIMTASHFSLKSPQKPFCFWLEKYIFVGLFKRDTSLFIPFIHTLIFLTFQSSSFLDWLGSKQLWKWKSVSSWAGGKTPQKKTHLGIVIAFCAWLVLPPLRREEGSAAAFPPSRRLQPCLFMAKWKWFNP